MKTLTAFQRMMYEGRPQLENALLADLGRDAATSYFMEINIIEHEIQNQMDNLKNWMKPEPVHTNLINLPGKSMIKRDPLGTCLIIGAWNYPVQLALCPLAGVIAAGNTCLIKMPSDKYTPATSHAMAELVERYLDKHVVTCIEGDRTATQAVLALKWDHIFYTGGSYVGKMVQAAAAHNLTPTVLELGGKSPCIVDQHADFAVSAKRIAWGAFTNCGQTCVRPDHVFVHHKAGQKFRACLIEAIRQLYGETPKNSKFYSRIVNERAFDRLSTILQKDANHISHVGFVTSFCLTLTTFFCLTIYP